MSRFIRYIIYVYIFSIQLSLANNLPLTLAFQTTVEQLNSKLVVVHFRIADGYHLYKNKIKIFSDKDSGVKIGTQILPPSLSINSSALGDIEVYEGSIDVVLPITSYGNDKLTLNLYYQGCKGLEACFPEVHEIKSLTLKSNFKVQQAQDNIPNVSLKQALTAFNANEIAQFFQHNFFLVYLGFFLIGILISFTPCVFPMFPILLTIIVNKHPTTRRAFILASYYVIGSALAYAISGIIAAQSGNLLQVILQNIWIKIITIILFILFAVSLFGVVNLQLPKFLESRFTQVKAPQSGISILLVGALSTLVLSPCVTPALAGVLLYIGSTGNIVFGAIALFILGVGSGLPLLIMSVFGNKVLPRSGNWMIMIKQLLGFLMLFMSIYILSNIIVKSWTYLLIYIWLLSLAIFLFYYGFHRKVKLNSLTVIGTIILVISSIWYTQNIKLLIPNQNENKFVNVINLAQLSKRLNIAKQQNQPVIIDFFANWCVACKEMDATTWQDPIVRDLLKNYILIKVDITSNDQDSKNLKDQFNVLAPPTLLFINKKGNVNKKCTIVGYINHEAFVKHLPNCL